MKAALLITGLFLIFTTSVQAAEPQWAPKNLSSGKPDGWKSSNQGTTAGNDYTWTPNQTTDTNPGYSWAPKDTGGMQSGDPKAVWKPGTGNEARETSNTYIKPNNGTPTAVKNKMMTPLMNGEGGPLKTLDGTFDVGGTLGTPNSNPFLKVIGLLDMASSTFTNLVIKLDRTMSGVADVTVVLPNDTPSLGGRPIAGACQNGFIGCTPNSSSDCKYVKFAAYSSASGQQVQYKPATVSDMSGCFCFSKECTRHNGSALFNLDTIYKDLSVPLAHTYLQTLPGIALTGVQTGSMGASFFGQLISTSQAALSKSATANSSYDMSDYPDYQGDGTTDISSYYGDRVYHASGDGNATMEKQKANPRSLYNLVKGVLQQGETTRSCNILRTIAAVPVAQETIEKAGSVTAPTDHTIWAGFWGPTDGFGDFRFVFWNSSGADGPWGAALTMPNDADPTSGTTIIKINKSEIAALGSYMDAKVTSVRFVTQAYNAGGGGNLDQTWSPGMSMPVRGVYGDTWDGGGMQTAIIDYHVYLTYMADKLVENVTDGCADLETERATGACFLKDEVWDDTRTKIRNRVETNSTFGDIRITLPGQVRSYEIIRPWAKIKRTYICTSSSNDFGDKINAAMQRVGTITSSISPVFGDSSTSIGYDNGFGGGSLTVVGARTTTNCPPMCKTKMPVANARVSQEGMVADTKTSETLGKENYEFIIKDCDISDDGTVETCPVDTMAGETVIEVCGCLRSDMNEMAASLEAIKTVKDDIICSED